MRPWLLTLLQVALALTAAALRHKRCDAVARADGPGEAQGTGARGRIFLLMMADDRIELERIWVRFLDGATHGADFMVFLHCERQDACLRNVERQDLFTIVPTVPSRYCSNLIGPELQLLSAAMNHSEPGSPRDKFVLVSHNSVPVKPWPVAHQLLTENMEGVAGFETKNETHCGLLWHHQWWSMSYWHAERFLAAARPEPSCGAVRRCLKGLPEPCARCMDAVWPLLSIYGADELRTLSRFPSTVRFQRVMWTDWSRKWIQEDYPAWRDVARWTQMTRQAEEGRAGPAEVVAANPALLSELASSPSPFARKFTRNTTFGGSLSLAEAFDRYIFNGTGAASC